MNQNRKLLGLLLTVGLSVVVYKWSMRDQITGPHTHSDTHSHSLPPTRFPLAIAPLTKTAMKAANNIQLPGEVSAECREEWKGILQLDLGETMTAPLQGGMLAFEVGKLRGLARGLDASAKRSSCRNLSPTHPLKSSTEKFRNSCLGVLKDPDAKLAPCIMEVISYRGSLMEEANRGKSLSEIKDSSTLINMFYASYLRSGPEDKEKMAVLSDRLVELFPKNEAAVGLALRAHYMKFSSDQSPNKESAQRSLETLLERTESQFPGSDLAMEIRLNLERLKGDQSALRKMTEDYSERFPQSEIPSYYSAWADYASGNRSGAIAILEEMVRTKPGSFYARMALDQIKSESGNPFNEMDTTMSVSFRSE